MKRVVSVWLPAWPISRLKRAEPQAVPLQQPFALVESGVHGLGDHRSQWRGSARRD